MKNIKPFWKGFFSAFNLFGYKIETPTKSDEENIADDWKQIGKDFEKVLGTKNKK